MSTYFDPNYMSLGLTLYLIIGMAVAKSWWESIEQVLEKYEKDPHELNDYEWYTAITVGAALEGTPESERRKLIMSWLSKMILFWLPIMITQLVQGWEGRNVND